MPINKVARAAIEELRSRFGVTDLTPDEVLELNDLGAAQLAAGKPRDGDERVAAPVRVGNVLLHPLTCGAQDFYERWQETPLPAALRTLLIPFAMCHAREPHWLEQIHTNGDLRNELRAFRRTAGATTAELDEAAADILSVENESPECEAGILSAVLQVCSWISSWDSAVAASVRDLCKLKLEEARRRREAENPRGAFHWRNLCVKLGAITGVSPDYWYSLETQLTLVAWNCVLEREERRAGADSVKPALVNAIKAMRGAMQRIVDARANRKDRNE